MISVIIPIYNSNQSYIDCINSVLNQTIKNTEIEIIIIDDGSINKDYIKKIPSLFKKSNVTYKIIEHKINMGVGAARNTGIKNSRGEFIAFLDSDDKWEENKLFKQLNILRNLNNVVMVGTLSTMPESIPPPLQIKKSKVFLSALDSKSLKIISNHQLL